MLRAITDSKTFSQATMSSNSILAGWSRKWWRFHSAQLLLEDVLAGDDVLEQHLGRLEQEVVALPLGPVAEPVGVLVEHAHLVDVVLGVPQLVDRLVEGGRPQRRGGGVAADPGVAPQGAVLAVEEDRVSDLQALQPAAV